MLKTHLPDVHVEAHDYAPPSRGPIHPDFSHASVRFFASIGSGRANQINKDDERRILNMRFL